MSQAKLNPYWHDAISDELITLMHHNTWDLVPALVSSNIVGHKRVFWVKGNSASSTDRYKAKLVTKRVFIMLWAWLSANIQACG